MANQDHPRILLVENEVLIAMSEKYELEQEGYRVLLSPSGENAIEVIGEDQNSVDLILMDIHLGKGLDGIETARQILAVHELPIVFLSSHSEKEVVERIEQVTSYGYVAKSSGSTVLNTSIQMALKLHQAHLRLGESEKRFQEVLENSLDAAYKRNLHTHAYDYMSPVFVQITGYTPGEIENLAIEDILDFIHREDLPEIERILAESIRGAPGKAYEVEYRFRHKDGDYRWLQDRFQVIWDERGSPAARIGSVRDITELKQTESQLSRWETIYRQADWGLVVSSQDGQSVALMTAAFAAMHGYTVEELSGKPILDLFAPEWREEAAAQIRIANQKSSYGFESVHLRKDGSTFPVSIQITVIRDETGVFQYRIVHVQDISERQAAAERLRQSEANLSLAMEVAGLAHWEYDPARDEFIFNDRFFALYGTQVEREGGYRIQPKHYADHFVHPEDMSYVSLHRFALASGVENPDFLPYIEHRITRADGSVGWVSVYTRILRDEAGNVIWMHGVNQDITERKRREDDTRFQAKLLNEVNQAVIATDLDGRYIYWNPFAEKIFGYRASERLGIINTDTFQCESLVEKTIDVRKQMLAGGVWKGELQAWDANQRPLILEVTASLLKDGQGNPTGYLSVMEEISPRKQAEAAIQKLLAEKETLIREIHHRVKNNMATITSLLNLQADLVRGTPAEEALRVAEHRVHSMEAIYDRLYRSGNYHELNAKAYLETLISDIAQTWKNPNLSVTVRQDIEPVELPIKISFPIGIILNECIANAHKHAFVGRSEGVIRIALHREPNGYVLSVADNGIGLPAAMDPARSSGFGLLLLNSMVRQLDGSLEVRRENGTEFQLILPMD